VGLTPLLEPVTRGAPSEQTDDVQPSAGVDKIRGADYAKERPRATATSLVVALRLAAVVALTVTYLVFWTSETMTAPDTFSMGSWAWMLLPPTILVASLIMGLWLRVPHPSRPRLYLGRASAVVTAIALVLACSFSLLYFFGELLDYLI
jgi:hypothetical protein